MCSSKALPFILSPDCCAASSNLSMYWLYVLFKNRLEISYAFVTDRSIESSIPFIRNALRTTFNISESRLKLFIPFRTRTRFFFVLTRSTETAISSSAFFKLLKTREDRCLSPEKSAPRLTARCDLPDPYPAIVITKGLSGLLSLSFCAILSVNEAVSMSLCLELVTSA